MIKKISILLFAILLNSCANNYHLLQPEKAAYTNGKKENGINVSYKYNQLRKKYKKYADKMFIRIVSVKITNNTENDLTFGEDFILTSYENTPLNILSTNEAYDAIRQKPATHLWYLLLAPLQLNTTESSSSGTTTTSSTPIGLIIGPGLALGNLLVADGANNKFKTELNNFNLVNKKIAKGETVYGLIAINDVNYPSIKATLK